MKTQALSLTDRLVRNLDVIRLERGMTAEDFARLTGLSRNTVNLWRKRRHAARLDVIEQAASALGLPDAAALLQLEAGSILDFERRRV